MHSIGTDESHELTRLLRLIWRNNYKVTKLNYIYVTMTQAAIQN